MPPHTKHIFKYPPPVLQLRKVEMSVFVFVWIKADITFKDLVLIVALASEHTACFGDMLSSIRGQNVG